MPKEPWFRGVWAGANMKWVSRMVRPNGHVDVTGRMASAIMQQSVVLSWQRIAETVIKQVVTWENS